MRNNTSDRSEAYYEGWNARNARLPEDEAQPYDWNSPEATEWITGWNDCDVEIGLPHLDDFE